MSKIVYKDFTIEHIVKPRIKHSYVSVQRDATVVLKTPEVSSMFVQELLLDKENWIRKQLDKIRTRPQLDVSIEDELILFGEIYSIDSPEALHLRELLVKVKTKKKEQVLKCYDKFYMSVSQEYLTQRVEHYAEVMNLSFNELRFKKLKSRWGSCSSHRVITLNTKLMQVKKECIDYVVVHELAHLVHMNHSKAFHEHVDKYIQDSKAIRTELKNTNIL